MKLEPGDVFVTCGKNWIAKAILAIEKIQSSDNEARYNHAGIIVDSNGKTFESLTRIEHDNLSAYKGCDILIARHINMMPDKFEIGYETVKGLDGVVYPYWRLVLHMLGLSKYLHAIHIPVCSELVARFLFACNFRNNYWGVNPDNLADEWQISKYYQIVYQGKWK